MNYLSSAEWTVVRILYWNSWNFADSSSIHSDEDNYDDIKSTVHNYQSARSQHYDQYRAAMTTALSPALSSAIHSPNPVSPSNGLCLFYSNR